MTARRIQTLPLPEPRLLDEETAAAYLGISKTGFRVWWSTKKVLPQPHKIGKRQLWDRRLLDQYVDALSGIDDQSGGWAL